MKSPERDEILEFVHHENIARFKKLLEAAADEVGV